MKKTNEKSIPEQINGGSQEKKERALRAFRFRDRIFEAAANGDSPLVQKLISSRANECREEELLLDVCGHHFGDKPPGHWASVAKGLLPFCDPRACDSKGWTPLMAAVLSDDPELVKLLLPLSDISAKDTSGRTALSIALSFNCPRTTPLLAAVGDTLTPDGHGQTPLMQALWNRRNNPEALSIAVAALLPRSNLAATDPWGRTALMRICDKEGWVPLNAPEARALIEKSDCRQQNIRGNTALHTWLRRPSEGTVEENEHGRLLALASDPLLRNEDGVSALDMAIGAGRVIELAGLLRNLPDAEMERALTELARAAGGPEAATRTEAFFLSRAMASSSAWTQKKDRIPNADGVAQIENHQAKPLAGRL